MSSEAILLQIQDVRSIAECALAHPLIPAGEHAFDEDIFIVPEVKELYPVVYALYKDPTAKAFREPVDAVDLHIPEYYTKIESPMSLRDVLDRIKDGMYSTAQQVEQDVALIWENAVKFNGPDNEISEGARACDEKFKQMVVDMHDNRPVPLDRLVKFQEQFEMVGDEDLHAQLVDAASRIQPSAIVDSQVSLDQASTKLFNVLADILEQYKHRRPNQF